MKLADLIFEANFTPYRTMVQVITDGESSTSVAEMIRALPGVTTVTITSHDNDRNMVVMKVKVISQKTGIEAFEALKKNALSKYQQVKIFKFAPKQIEKLNKSRGE